MARKTIRLEKAEQGLKLASAVVTVAGQRLLSAGVMLDEEKIQLLKKHGVRYIQVFEQTYDEPVDTQVFSEIIKNLGVTEAPSAAALEPPRSAKAVLPPAPPAPAAEDAQAKTERVRKKADEVRERLTEDKRKYSDKYGERYTSVSYTLGDPAPFSKSTPYAPYVDLLSLLARDMTDKLIFERKIDAETIQVLVKDIVSELSSHGSVMQLLTAAYSVSRYLLSHMVNVGLYSMRVASEMKLTQAEVTDITVGAILHDIGMVLIPVGFWTTRRELTPRARSEVQKHPELGAQLIRETPGTQEAWSLPALEHHERLDGSGYPSGKPAGKLSLASRIVQLCDVYEALTSDRSYRYAKFPDISMKHILGSPEQFDRDIAQVFCKCLGFYPEGYQVKLATGETAVVLSSNPKNVFRPVVKLLTDAAGTDVPPEAQLVLDLTNRLDLRVIEISNRRAIA
ncbi:HD domain-containing protein [bacterium]|nr:HD domain-containing protein [bacterium]